MNAPLDTFETALLNRLRDEVEHQATVRSRLSQPKFLVGAAAAAVAAAAVVLVVVPGLGTTAAYSVQEGNAGIITVQVQRLEDAEGLEAELSKYGVDANITYLPDKQECAPGRYTPVDRSLSGMQVSMGSELLRVTLPPGAVRDDETFVMAVSGQGVPPSSSEPSEDGVIDLGGFAGWADLNVTAGPVEPCTVVPGTVE